MVRRRPDPPASLPGIAADRSTPPAGRARVLIVDDDARNLIALATLLEDAAEVVTAASGDAALRELLTGDFAVILLDVYMPGLDGYQTADLIRRRKRSQRIPIIFLSAVNKEQSHLIRGYAMGAVDYVFKPVEPVVLRSKIAVFVDLYEKTREIEIKAASEQLLLDTALRANAERLAVEQALRIAEQRQAAIIESLPIVLYLARIGDGAMRFAGGDLTGLTGLTAAVLEPDGAWIDRVHPDDRERVAALRAARPSPEGMAIEYRWQCADGRYKQFLDQAVLLRDTAGQPTEFAGSLLDITERKILELELVQARKMDAIGRLTGGIAHDFNNLLGAVLGGLSLVERRVALDDDQLKIIRMTRHAAEKGADLVRRLLAFARRQQLEPAPVDIVRLAARVDELLSHTLGGLVELEWHLADTTWPALADESQLELAIMNLIINARDAMPDGGKIIVDAANCPGREPGDMGSEGGDYVVLTVTDHGSGIPAEVLPQVLEPFFTTKEEGKGTGLGLSMVYGFAQQSGGSLRLSSEVGVGTRVRLALPRAFVTGADVAADAGTGVDPAPVLRQWIALLDDHDGMRATTRALLTDLGHHVTEFARGSELLSHIADQANRVDLLITDYAMPQLSGTEVIALARATRPGLPALLITGYAEARALATAGDVSVLQKPFTSAQLSLAVAMLAAAAPPATPSVPVTIAAGPDPRPVTAG